MTSKKFVLTEANEDVDVNNLKSELVDIEQELLAFDDWTESDLQELNSVLGVEPDGLSSELAKVTITPKPACDSGLRRAAKRSAPPMSSDIDEFIARKKTRPMKLGKIPQVDFEEEEEEELPTASPIFLEMQMDGSCEPEDLLRRDDAESEELWTDLDAAFENSNDLGKVDVLINYEMDVNLPKIVGVEKLLGDGKVLRVEKFPEAVPTPLKHKRILQLQGLKMSRKPRKRVKISQEEAVERADRRLRQIEMVKEANKALSQRKSIQRLMSLTLEDVSGTMAKSFDIEIQNITTHKSSVARNLFDLHFEKMKQ